MAAGYVSLGAMALSRGEHALARVWYQSALEILEFCGIHNGREMILEQLRVCGTAAENESAAATF